MDKSIDIFCMSETWLYDSDPAIISVLTPKSYVLHQVSCPDKNAGGVGYLINKSIQSKKEQAKGFKSFKYMEVHISNERKK